MWCPPNRMSSLLLLILCFLFVTPTIQKDWDKVKAKDKYSKEANTKPLKVKGSHEDDDGIANFKDLVKPFRMNKLNIVWDKAVHRLTEVKLKSLYGELKFQDKEELRLKRLKADGQDKEGLMEAEIRRKFKGILNTFSLSNLFGEEYEKKIPDDHENRLHKKLFKDKKLNRLWDKAEKSGFTEKELKALKEEFGHHQDKLDEYHAIMESLTAEEKNLMHNDIPDMNALLDDVLAQDGGPVDPSSKKMDSKYNQIVGTHRELKEGYEKLRRKAVAGQTGSEFTEPRVEALWKLVLGADFSSDELSSLRTELKHYETRINKLNHIQAEYILKSQYKDRTSGHTDKDTLSLFEDKIKKHERVVEKIHAELEERLGRRHSEL